MFTWWSHDQRIGIARVVFSLASQCRVFQWGFDASAGFSGQRARFTRKKCCTNHLSRLWQRLNVVLSCPWMFYQDVTWSYIISMFSMLTCLKYVNVTLLWYYDSLCLWLWLWGRVASCTSTKMPQAILTPDCAIPHHDAHKAVQCECQSIKTAGFWDATGKAERLR